MMVYVCDCCGAVSQPIPYSDRNEYKPNDKFVYNNGINLCDDCEKLRQDLNEYVNHVLTKYRRKCNHEHNKHTGQNKVEPSEIWAEENPEKPDEITKMLYNQVPRKVPESTTIKTKCLNCDMEQVRRISKLDDGTVKECIMCRMEFDILSNKTKQNSNYE